MYRARSLHHRATFPESAHLSTSPTNRTTLQSRLCFPDSIHRVRSCRTSHPAVVIHLRQCIIPCFLNRRIPSHPAPPNSTNHCHSLALSFIPRFNNRTASTATQIPPVLLIGFLISTSLLTRARLSMPAAKYYKRATASTLSSNGSPIFENNKRNTAESKKDWKSDP
jgi:hypothetical protein